MTCAERRATLVAYVDQELPAAERAELEAHLAECAECREALAVEQRLSSRLAELPAPLPPGDFEARFWARIAREEDARAHGWRAALGRLFRPRGLIALAGAAVAAVALVLALRSTPPEANGDVDWQIAADAEDFELLQDPDLDIAQVADILEKMERDPDQGRGPG